MNRNFKTITAVFDSVSQAEIAARQIKEKGFEPGDISIVAKNRSENKPAGIVGDSEISENLSEIDKSKVKDNISDGVVTGGVLGGLTGLLIGAGSMAVPGLGIIAAAGPVAGLLSGMVTGGIVGGLIDLGIPEKRGRQYETDINAGKTLFSMKAENAKIDEIAAILRKNGAVSVDTF
ncbi:MAG: hypothetical protein Q7J78_03010 [Clostridiales bacterium]|nr:hypothetical protein [Clostridiales bacterium]